MTRPPPSNLAIGAALTLLALLTALVWWLDRSQTQAGLIALLLLTFTTGFLHGALDAVILWQQVRPTGRALLWALAYLVAVLLLGLVFAPHAGAALLLLLLLSVWHFGEPFGEPPNETSGEKKSEQPIATHVSTRLAAGFASRFATRIVLGGAPVMLPALLSVRQLESPSTRWIYLNDPWVWPAWQALAWGWLALLVIWAVLYARPHWPAARWTLAEVAVLALLNLLLTPLMAFAIYFGLYHAPVHIRRVARASAIRNIAASPLALLTLLATLVLGALLFAWRGTDIGAQQTSQAQYVEWLVVALLALTVPHLVLISYVAPWLSQPGKNTANRAEPSA